MSSTGTPVLLSLGSNVGDSVSNIRAAIAMLQANDVVFDVAVSRWYRTEPVGYVHQPTFVNVAVAGATTLGAVELVHACKRVEQAVGRTLRERWRQREIDVDVILVGSSMIDEGDVCVPHPRMHERLFVLRPSCDVAPTMTHPVLSRTIADLAAACTDTAAVDCFDPDVA